MPTSTTCERLRQALLNFRKRESESLAHRGIGNGDIEYLRHLSYLSHRLKVISQFLHALEDYNDEDPEEFKKFVQQTVWKQSYSLFKSGSSVPNENSALRLKALMSVIQDLSNKTGFWLSPQGY